MKPPPFEYMAPASLEEALALLAQHGDSAKVLAGGQSLVPMMNFRLVAPSILVDLNRLAELAYIREREGGLTIGAMTRQRQAERDPLVAQRAPLLAETMPFVAHPQIRNRGTVGGSLAHADPAAELPAVTVALDAQFRLLNAQGERWLPASDFFAGLFSTALKPTELLAEIALPALPPHTGCAFQEMSRRHGDYALAGVATVVTLDERGAYQNVRMAFLGVGPQPILAANAAKQLIGTLPTEQAIRDAASAAGDEIDPGTDIHASAQFRRHLAQVLARRALTSATARARQGTA